MASPTITRPPAEVEVEVEEENDGIPSDAPEMEVSADANAAETIHVLHAGPSMPADWARRVFSDN